MDKRAEGSAARERSLLLAKRERSVAPSPKQPRTATARLAAGDAPPPATAKAKAPRPPVPEGRRVRLLDVQPGECVRLPVSTGFPETLGWSEPVTVTRVLLIDTELVEVRWATAKPEDAWKAHRLLIGAAYRAGAIRVPLPTDPTRA